MSRLARRAARDIGAQKFLRVQSTSTSLTGRARNDSDGNADEGPVPRLLHGVKTRSVIRWPSRSIIRGTRAPSVLTYDNPAQVAPRSICGGEIRRYQSDTVFTAMGNHTPRCRPRAWCLAELGEGGGSCYRIPDAERPSAFPGNLSQHSKGKRYLMRCIPYEARRIPSFPTSKEAAGKSSLARRPVVGCKGDGSKPMKSGTNRTEGQRGWVHATCTGKREIYNAGTGTSDVHVSWRLRAADSETGS